MSRDQPDEDALIAPAPLLWIRGLIRSDPSEVAQRIRDLLREGPAVLQETEALCFEAFHALLSREDVTADEETINVLAAQFLDATAAARLLLVNGHLRAAYSQMRTMIESRVVMEYIRGNEERARRWSRASAPAERREFSFEAVYRESDMAELWKEMWDSYNEIIHTNRGAQPAQSRIRPVFGIDSYVGPFYDPQPLANTFLIVMAFAQWFGGLIHKWYADQPLLPSNFASRLDGINSAWQAYARALQTRAAEEQRRVDQETGTLPLEEQIRAELILRLRAGKPPRRD